MIKGGGFHAIGRRKEAVARVYLRPGTGKFLVNGTETKEYFGRVSLELLIKEPLVVSGVVEKYDVLANVTGGGKSGQAGALRMALGSRSVNRATEICCGSLEGNLRAFLLGAQLVMKCVP